MTQFKTLVLGGLLVAAGMAGQAFAADAKPAFAGPTLDYKSTVSGTYVLDSSHASVVWKVWHAGFSHFAGRFDEITGTATVNPADLSKSGVVISIKSDSADTGVDKLDDELEEKDFFDSEKYPAITFTSTKLELGAKTKDGKDTGKLYGMLSMKGVTKPVVLDVVYNGHAPGPFSPGERIGFEATTSIKRSEFGFTHLVPMVSDQVDLIISVEFTKKD